MKMKSRIYLGCLLVLVACGDDSATPPPPGSDAGPQIMCEGVLDTDNDSIGDREEGSVGIVDTDADGTADFLDSDSDNDTFMDRVEAGDASCATPPVDTDGDSIPDFRDGDSDGNGIPDVREGMGDYDADGSGDVIDPDDDGDMIDDVTELAGRTDFPRDSDDDGQPDFRDVDADGDTIADVTERGADTDLDETPDAFDLDSDADTIPDSVEAGDADVDTAPIDSDDDGVADFRDRDSDADGLPDDLESVRGTDPRVGDSDGDMVSDLIEDAAGTDPLDAEDNPRVRGDFVFVVPYDEDPAPRRDTLRFRTNIQFADVYFLFDITGSMSGEISAMRSAVTSIIDNITCSGSGSACAIDADCGDVTGEVCGPDGTCIENPETTGCIASMWTGVGTYEGLVGSYRNLLSLQPDPATTQRSIPTSASGAGGAEELFEAAACVADPTACGMAGGTCTVMAGAIGCPAFRRDAVRILAHITDEDNQCTGCLVNTAVDAGSRILSERITYVGVDCDLAQSPRADLEALARAADSFDASGAPLYFAGNEARVTDAVTEAVREIALGIPLFVVVQAEDLPDDAGDALQFILRTEVNLDEARGCTPDARTADLNSDGFDDAFPFLLPGRPVCWDVVARRNTRVRPTREPQVFRAKLTVLGDDSPLDSRNVFFLVPPEIEITMIK
jgi:hypothetical protein